MIAMQVETFLHSMIDHNSTLDAVAEHIHEKIGKAGSYTMTHPAELRWFQTLNDDHLRELAEKHDLDVVRHAGGIQFKLHSTESEGSY